MSVFRYASTHLVWC